MRLALVGLVVLLGWGCAARKADGRARVGAIAPTAESKPGATTTLDTAWVGRVVLVNPALRFVVMDFPVRKMPAVDQRLNVYHNGQKTGEIRVTGPTRDTTTAGDILSGEAQAGDEVRDD
jgi:hypothetical protein